MAQLPLGLSDKVRAIVEAYSEGKEIVYTHTFSVPTVLLEYGTHKGSNIMEYAQGTLPPGALISALMWEVSNKKEEEKGKEENGDQHCIRLHPKGKFDQTSFWSTEGEEK